MADTDPTVRAAAAGALGRVHAVQAIPALLSTLTDPDPGVGQTALAALDTIDPRWPGSPDARDAVPRLVRSLQYGPGQPRVAEALARIKDPVAVPLLIRLLPAPDPEVYRAVRTTLAAVNPEWPLSAAAAESAGRFRADLVGERTPAVAQAIELVGDIRDRAAVPRLIFLAAHHDEELRHAATLALEKIEPDWPRSPTAREALPGLVHAVSLPAVSAHASALLGRINHPAAVPLLLALPHDLGVESQTAVVRALDGCDPGWRTSSQAREALRVAFAGPLRGGRAIPLWATEVAVAAGAESDPGPAIEVLRLAYWASTPDLWYRAKQSLLEAGRRNPGELLGRLRSDPDPIVREAVADALGHPAPDDRPLPEPAPVAEALAAGLDDPDPLVQVACARSLGRGGHRTGVGALVAVLARPRAPSALVEAATTSVGAVGDAQAAAPLFKLLEAARHDMPRIQVAAATALIRILGAEAIEPLRAYANKWGCHAIDHVMYDAILRHGRADGLPNTADVIRMRASHRVSQKRGDRLDPKALAREFADLSRTGTAINLVALAEQVRLILTERGREPEELLRELDGRLDGSILRSLAASWGVGGYWRGAE